MGNMEGITNEHQSSTGINDCLTQDMDSPQVCARKGEAGAETMICPFNFTIKGCGVPSIRMFDKIFEMFDTNLQDWYLEEREIDPNVLAKLVRGPFVPRDTNFFGE